MILIFSQNEYEYTTDLVFDWVIHLGGNAKRVNGKELIENKHRISLSNESHGFTFNDIDPSQVSTIWYRRWFNSDYKLSSNKKVNSYLKREYYALSQYFFSCFEETKWYNKHNYLQDFISKTEQLIIAKQVGFKIPDTIVTNNKKELLSFFEKHKSIIIKPLSEIESFYDKKTKKILGTFTEKITKDYIDKNIPSFFYPSLFQKEIDKKYELRIFYDKGECYSMAIFSTKNSKTQVDFRQYDNILPNRRIPFKLTTKEENTIRKFMKKANLETGSLDIIYTHKNELVFLEVNPLGQFGMVSGPCNYYIEKKIAQRLIEKDYEK